MIGKCPKCESENIVAEDVLQSSSDIVNWDREENGTMYPNYTGETEVWWDTSRPRMADKPFACTECGMELALTDIIFTEEPTDG